MKKYYLIPLLFALLFSLTAHAGNNPKLFGHWKNSKVSLNLKPNGRYHYHLNALVDFSGRWTSTADTITLHYTLITKKKKTVHYRLKGNTLIVIKSGRPNVRLKKVK